MLLHQIKKENIPSYLKKIRKKSKLTQYDLAYILDTNQGKLSMWEAGKFSISRLKFLGVLTAMESFCGMIDKKAAVNDTTRKSEIIKFFKENKHKDID